MAAGRGLLGATLLCVACSSSSPPADGGPRVPLVDGEPGCDAALFRPSGADLSARGGYDVGALTLSLPRLRAEVWYPALPGSQASQPPRVYDIREALEPVEAARVADDQNPWQPCDCAEGLPLDTKSGPFPVVVFVHGTASFRTQSLGLVTQLASRGFVVVAADHPGLMLRDTLAFVCGYETTGPRDLRGDIALLLDTLGKGDGPLSFLAGHIDLSRVGLVGHSAGANAVADAADLPGVQAVAALAGSAPVDAPGVRSLFLAALEDGVVPPDQSYAAFAASGPPKAYAALSSAGHLAFSDLCETENAAGQTLLEVGQEVPLCGADLAGFLFDCDPSFLSAESRNPAIDAAVAATLERALLCRTHDLAAALSSFEVLREPEAIEAVSTDAGP